MELKVVCGCGQKYKFDVQPVNGFMPFAVNCPVCGVDGTPAANSLIAAQGPTTPPPSGVSSLRISNPAPSAPPVAPVMAPPPPIAAGPRPLPGPAAVALKKGEFNLPLGILGAAIGAGVGAGLMYVFFLWANFRFPLMGTGIGALSGLGARILYKGTDSMLGMISAAIALAATVATLHFMYGEMAGLFVLTMIASAFIAWRIAS